MAADGQIGAPLAFFDSSGFADQTQAQYPPSFVHVMGLAPPAADVGSDGWVEPARKRLKEQELLENSQISSIDFMQTRSVSTGLGLSLDDRRLAGSSSADSPLFSLIGDDIDRELQRQEAEMDRFLKVQSERLRQAVLEKVQAKQLQTLTAVEDKILRKLRDTEAEVENMNKKNTELEDQMKQLSAEAEAWQNHARYNENLIANLRFNLQQLFAQGRESKEGCGESEVDDTASCCNGNPNDFRGLLQQQKVGGNAFAKELAICKACRTNEVCMLLLPCRHLCLCKECESKLSMCPLCKSSKFIGMEVYM